MLDILSNSYKTATRLDDLGLTANFVQERGFERAQPRPTIKPTRPSVVSQLKARLQNWARGQQAMRRLQALDDHMLNDIGFDRSMIRDSSQPVGSKSLRWL